MGKKNKNKKYRPTYTTGGRVDMRTGGRVKAQVGGVQQKPQKPISTPDEKPVIGGPVGDPVPFNEKREEKEDPPNDRENKKPPVKDTRDVPETNQGEGQAFNAGRGTISFKARRERIARTEALKLKARAAGESSRSCYIT